MFLWRCSGTDKTYCCGEKFQSCCEESSISTFEVEVATDFFRPPNSDESTAGSTSFIATSSIDAGPSSIESSTSSTRTTTLNQSTSTTETPVENTGTSIPDQQGSNHQDLVIGLGVGTPLAIGIIAALIFLGIQMKRRNRSAAAHSKVLLEQQPVLGLSNAWPHELNGKSQPTELTTEQHPRELPG